jgi:membrane protease YdiL (CAAX protease family)
MEADKIKIVPVFISIAVLLLTEAVAKVLFSESLISPMITLGAIRFLEAFLFIMIVVTWGKGLSSIGLAPYQILPGIMRGFIWSAAFGIIVLFIFGALYIAGINPLALIQVRLPNRIQELLSFFFVGGLIAPIAEEIFFRGILYGFFRRWGVVVAIFLSTLIFVFAHLIDTAIPVTQAIGGIVFAAAYEVEGKLMVPISIHVLGNNAIFSLSLLF